MKILVSLLFSITILFAGCKKESGTNKKAKWIKNAFKALNGENYPRVKAISWWHENFDNSLLRIDSSPEGLVAYRSGVSSSYFLSNAQFQSGKLAAPVTGIYHAAFPDFGGTEDIVTAQRIDDFVDLVDKDIAWAYFSNNWSDSIRFPSEAVSVIHATGKIPFIRMMARSDFEEGGPDPRYSMQRIIDGDFDGELIRWAMEAAQTGIPLLTEFGTEVNGNWFPWNGQYNGGGTTTGYGDPALPDGPERFRDAYRHIIEICRANGATNITWFFHVDAYSQPDATWNNLENYYPGDDYIDWLGVSVYGPQEPGDEYREFSEILDDVYPALSGLSNKPVAILEFAITELN
ncbi:MAG: beta-mannanase [Chlorobi bacterium]|nr:beta-mannanase [Chlorobiota bacterium]